MNRATFVTVTAGVVVATVTFVGAAATQAAPTTCKERGRYACTPEPAATATQVVVTARTATPTPTARPTSSATATRTTVPTSTRTPASTKTPPPPTTSPTAIADGFPYADPQGERAQLVTEVNRTRAVEGLYALPRSEGLMRLAQWRAEDMNRRRYSGHEIPPGVCYSGPLGSRCASTPTYVWDWYDLEGIRWSPSAGENLWLGGDYRDQMAEVANRVFVGSPSHYAGMLAPWGGIGTGMDFGLWPGPAVHVVEVFTDLQDAPPLADAYDVEILRSPDGSVSHARGRRRALPTATPVFGLHGLAASTGCVSPTERGQLMRCVYGALNTDTAGDTLEVHSVRDVVNAAPTSMDSGNLLPTLTVDRLTGAAHCLTGAGATVPLGGTGSVRCVLPPGAGVTLGTAGWYRVDTDDPTLLQNTVAIGWTDRCDGGSANCVPSPAAALAVSQTLLTTPLPTPTVPAGGTCAVEPALIPLVPPAGASALVVLHAEAERQLLDTINAYRATPYVWDDTLSKAAAWMAADLAARDDFRYESWSTRQTFPQHTDSLGRDLLTRLRSCGYTGDGPVGENLDGEVHYGEGDAATLSAWTFAAEELALVTSPTYRKIGLARHYSPHAQTPYQGVNRYMVWMWVMVVSG